MARNTKTAAPAPENGPDLSQLNGGDMEKAITRKQPPAPRAGALKVARVDPVKLATMTPAEMRKALAEIAAQAKAARPTRQARPRISLSADAKATYDALGWHIPYTTAEATYQPQERTRFNESKGSAAYTVLVAALQVGPITLTDAGRLWLASGNPAKPSNALIQQLANRAQQPIQQQGETLQLTA